MRRPVPLNYMTKRLANDLSNAALGIVKGQHGNIDEEVRWTRALRHDVRQTFCNIVKCWSVMRIERAQRGDVGSKTSSSLLQAFRRKSFEHLVIALRYAAGVMVNPDVIPAAISDFCAQPRVLKKALKGAH